MRIRPAVKPIALPHCATVFVAVAWPDTSDCMRGGEYEYEYDEYQYEYMR
jgi:hypothetical protein